MRCSMVKLTDSQWRTGGAQSAGVQQFGDGLPGRIAGNAQQAVLAHVTYKVPALLRTQVITGSLQYSASPSTTTCWQVLR